MQLLFLLHKQTLFWEKVAYPTTVDCRLKYNINI